MSTRVIIVSDEYTPLQCEVLEEQLQAKLNEHTALRARYIPPNANAAIAAGLAQDSGASLEAGDGNMVDAGQTTGPANPALFGSAHSSIADRSIRKDEPARVDGDAERSAGGKSTASAVAPGDYGALLDRIQLAALRAFRSGLPAREYPLLVFRRIFDLERLGLVEKQGDAYWITNRGLAALRDQ